MSKLFNYSHIKDVYNKNGMLPGQQGFISGNDQIGVGIAVDDDYLENGQVVAVAIVDGKTPKFRKIATSDLATAFYGIVLADIHSQINRVAGQPQFIYKYKNQSVSVLRTGYVWVPVQDDQTITAGAGVYVRVTASSTNTYLPIGGIETGADSGKCLAWTGASFTGQVGYPLSATTNGTSSSGLTAKVAQIKLEGHVLA